MFLSKPMLTQGKISTMKKIIITRPLQDGLRLAEKITALGFEPVIMPMIEIEILPRTPNLESINSLIFTSCQWRSGTHRKSARATSTYGQCRFLRSAKKPLRRHNLMVSQTLSPQAAMRTRCLILICQQADNQDFLYHARCG